MMTNVIPMAMTAMMEDCTRMLFRLIGDRKRSVSKVVTTQRPISVNVGIWPIKADEEIV